METLAPILYVGRISLEKNLDQLLASFMSLLADGHQGQLVLVGDGPHLEDLASRYRRPEIVFTGFLHGGELATAYASADAFVFPSTTDTFGNAVLEAQACGLPAVVSDRGGPQAIVLPPGEVEASGWIVEVSQPGALTETMAAVQRDAVGRARMAKLGLDRTGERRLDVLLEALWDDTPQAREEAALAHHFHLRDEDRQLATLAAGP